jgi:hypothetical protein
MSSPIELYHLDGTSIYMYVLCLLNITTNHIKFGSVSGL